MDLKCKQCGSELLPEMRFCRRCGRPTGLLSVTESATQQLPAGDLSHPGGMTTPSYSAPQNYPQSPMPSPRRRRIWPWFVGGFLALAIGAAAAVGVLFMHFRDQWPTEISVTDEGTKITTRKGNEIVIPTGSGDRSELRTVHADRVPLGNGQEFAVTATAGRITVSTWDEGDAEIRFIKRGGNLADQEKVNTLILSSGRTVRVKAETPSNSPVTVDMEVKLPPGITLSSSSLETISGPINVSFANSGSLHARSVSGDVRVEAYYGDAVAKTVSGAITFSIPESNRPLDTKVDLASAGGKIQLLAKPWSNVKLDLKTLSGTIAVDPGLDWGFSRQGLLGRHVKGRVGSGDMRVSIKTVSGNITIGQ